EISRSLVRIRATRIVFSQLGLDRFFLVWRQKSRGSNPQRLNRSATRNGFLASARFPSVKTALPSRFARGCLNPQKKGKRGLTPRKNRPGGAAPCLSSPKRKKKKK